MIKFRIVHDVIVAVLEQTDGSTNVVARVKSGDNPSDYRSWVVEDEKLNAVAKITLGYAISNAYCATKHASVLHGLLRNGQCFTVSDK